MAPTTCILCPVDFSAFSRHALDCAVHMARSNGARVVALHVFTNWPAVAVVPSLSRTQPTIALKDVDQEALMTCLRDFVRSYASEPVKIEVRVAEAADVRPEILAQADTLHAGLIVIGSHGRSGFERLLLGSTTEWVLRHARCPVMVVPRRVGQFALKGRPFTQILCPVDFSCDAIAALARASTLAHQTHGELTVLHVIEVPAAFYETPGFDIAAYRCGAEAQGRKRLSEIVPEHMLPSTHVIVCEGRPDQEILRVAAERESDLIVMGVHGRPALDLAVFGSTTHRVIRGASCPVLTIGREESAS